VAVGTPSVVGADFMVSMSLMHADPTDIHWIQFVTTNHPLDGPHGKPATTLDISKNLVPYYDYTVRLVRAIFFDTPRRNDVTRTHTWTADLFLVTVLTWSIMPCARTRNDHRHLRDYHRRKEIRDRSKQHR
jgi:hypothetical protein